MSIHLRNVLDMIFSLYSHGHRPSFASYHLSSGCWPQSLLIPHNLPTNSSSEGTPEWSSQCAGLNMILPSLKPLDGAPFSPPWTLISQDGLKGPSLSEPTPTSVSTFSSDIQPGSTKVNDFPYRTFHCSVFLPSFSVSEEFFTAFSAYWINYHSDHITYPLQPHPTLSSTPVELITPFSVCPQSSTYTSHLPLELFISIYKPLSLPSLTLWGELLFIYEPPVSGIMPATEESLRKWHCW